MIAHTVRIWAEEMECTRFVNFCFKISLLDHRSLATIISWFNVYNSKCARSLDRANRERFSHPWPSGCFVYFKNNTQPTPTRSASSAVDPIGAQQLGSRLRDAQNVVRHVFCVCVLAVDVWLLVVITWRLGWNVSVFSYIFFCKPVR